MFRRNAFGSGCLSASIVLGFAACALSSATASADETPLRYRLKKGQSIAYRVEITADTDEVVDAMQGIIRFTANEVQDHQLQLTYQGGLSRVKNFKPRASAHRGFDPFARGFPRAPFGPRGPFGGSSLPSGLRQTTNELVLSPRGAIQSLRGDSQLPYLLGNLSIFVFEPLPQEAERQWTVETGISIEEGGESMRRPFGPPGFFNDEPKTRTSGSERTTFSLQKQEGDRIVAEKTYELSSPTGDGGTYAMTGAGTWTFDKKVGASESIDYKLQLAVTEGNTTVNVPITIKYQRLTDDELARHDEEQRQRSEELRRQHEERMKKEAETPLTAEEKKKLLADLKSSNDAVVLSALHTLNRKTNAEPDAGLAISLRSLKGHRHLHVRQEADKAFAKYGGDAVAGKEPETHAMRTWQDATGAFSVEAEFVRFHGDTIELRRKDGRTVKVPVDRLSSEDRAFVDQLQQTLDNPFEP